MAFMHYEAAVLMNVGLMISSAFNGAICREDK